MKKNNNHLKLAIVYAFGSVEDRSINEYLKGKIHDIKKEIKAKIPKKAIIRPMLPNNGLTGVYDLLKREVNNYDFIVALGGSFVEGRFEAFDKERREKLKENDSHCQLAVIDSRLRDKLTWFNEKDHAKPSGYLAAKICAEREMKRVAFIGGARIHVVDKWRKGFKAGVDKYNEDEKREDKVEVITEFIGPTSKSFIDEHAAYHITKDLLKWKKPSVIMQVCGKASLGVLKAISEFKRSEDNSECFVIFTDFHPEAYLDDSLYQPVVFSVFRKLENAISYWIIKSEDETYKDIYKSGFQADIIKAGFKVDIISSGKEGPSWGRLGNILNKSFDFQKEWNYACNE